MNGDFVVETCGLTKRYGRELVAVKDLDLNVRLGEIYGFLGLNGAGKTTTLRMLLGLIEPTAGTVRVLDGEPGSPSQNARVGSLIEAPTFYGYLSGRDNLTGMARLSGVANAKGRVEETLAQVGLADRAKDKFKKYSLGMKQRLGVAAALVKDPELLILDEPTNGFDARGMIEMRTLIRSLGGQRTILFSSHLMDEVEEVCDRVGVIDKGEMVAEGTVDELRGKRGILVRAIPLQEAARVAGGVTGVESVEIKDGTLHVTADPNLVPEISHELFSAGVRFSEIRPSQRSLEEAFLELTAEDGRYRDGGESILRATKAPQAHVYMGARVDLRLFRGYHQRLLPLLSGGSTTQRAWIPKPLPEKRGPRRALDVR